MYLLKTNHIGTLLHQKSPYFTPKKSNFLFLSFYRAKAATAIAAAAAPKELSLLPLLPGTLVEEAVALEPGPVGEPPVPVVTVTLELGKGTEVERVVAGAEVTGAPPVGCCSEAVV